MERKQPRKLRRNKIRCLEDFEDIVKGVKQLWKASIKDAKANRTSEKNAVSDIQ